jgi:predicted AAA+ superfamily ATPase
MRYIAPLVLQAIEKQRKMAFVSGPRQVGKTTFGQLLVPDKGFYFNWDIEADRRAIIRDAGRFFETASGLPKRMMLDEIHKYPRWKRMLKGIYDDVGKEVEIVVTGSGNLEVYQKGGDSLFGRYRSCRLHPFSTGELAQPNRNDIPSPDDLLKNITSGIIQGSSEALDQITKYGGFPEPLFAANKMALANWRRQHRELILREDLRDLSRVREIGLIDTLVMMLPEKVGSPLSVNSLREDLNVSFNTVQNWMSILAKLFFLFEIRPYTGNLARTLSREAKVYLFDSTSIENEGPRFENIAALHLKKACDAWTDWGYGEFDLHYVRDKEKRECDFLITLYRKPYALIESKLSGDETDRNLIYFYERIKPKFAFQMIRNFPRGLKQVGKNPVYLCEAHRLLAALP